MSFSENPYEELTIIISPDQKECKWSCGGCGGTSRERVWDTATSVITIQEDFLAHIKKSHARTRDDFNEWRSVWPHG